MRAKTDDVDLELGRRLRAAGAKIDAITADLAAFARRGLRSPAGRRERTALDAASGRLDNPPRPPSLARAPTATVRPGIGAHAVPRSAEEQLAAASVRSAVLMLVRRFPSRSEDYFASALLDVMRAREARSLEEAVAIVVQRLLTGAA